MPLRSKPSSTINAPRFCPPVTAAGAAAAADEEITSGAALLASSMADVNDSMPAIVYMYNGKVVVWYVNVLVTEALVVGGTCQVEPRHA